MGLGLVIVIFTAILGFYLPIHVLMWLLALRALGIEMKHHLHHPLWDELWDVVFFAASLLITVFLGVLLGNLIRGVSLDASGQFFAPLWTNFGVGEQVGILDWFSLLVGVTAAFGVGLHGATWLAYRVEGPLSLRAGRLVNPLLSFTLLSGLATSAGLLVVRSDLKSLPASRPLVLLLPAISLLGLGAVFLFARRRNYKNAFLGSATFLGAAVLTAAATLYPNVLVGRVLDRSISAAVAKTSDYGLRAALYWWIPGVALAISYFVFLYRRLPRAVRDADLDEHQSSA